MKTKHFEHIKYSLKQNKFFKNINDFGHLWICEKNRMKMKAWTKVYFLIGFLELSPIKIGNVSRTFTCAEGEKGLKMVLNCLPFKLWKKKKSRAQKRTCPDSA